MVAKREPEAKPKEMVLTPIQLSPERMQSIGVTFGCAVGARVAHAVPAAFLARVVAVALMLVGVVVAVRSGHTLARTW